ncbi:MAG TPA: phytanoyl-CoA dioxygenase family protein [Acidimicrobiales bacterium]|nr:phytanoyl-CoA dioxygenase family protein [Acidimicrobiales bacterium]
MGVRASIRRGALTVGRTGPMQRLLRLYEDQGLVAPAVVATDDAEARARRDLWDRYLPRLPQPTLEDLTEHLDDSDLPPLDRAGVDPSTLTADQRQWWEEGFVLKEGFIPDDLLDAYWARRSQLEDLGGWPQGAPYLTVPEALNLSVYRPLVDLLGELIGEPMAVNLNLTGIVSTERNWHQDDYLNYSGTKSWYCAVWFAVKDIDPESGPFQYVPGSHRWPVVRRDRIRLFLPPEDREGNQWPKKTEAILDPVLIEEIARRGAEVRTFLGKKGDVLIWHGRLVHRGSPPAVPGTIRHSFIAHYTGINHWANGPNVGHHPDGGMYFLDA